VRLPAPSSRALPAAHSTSVIISTEVALAGSRVAAYCRARLLPT
jgi:hypothetical protein